MTEIEPYHPATDLEPTDTWVPVLADIAHLASKIADTDFVPAAYKGNTAAVAASILYGRELGLPPMTSLTAIDPIKGTPSLSAEAMRALILAAGHELRFVENTSSRCVLEGRRKGQEQWTRVAYTMDEAKQSGDAGKNALYRSRPQEMMVARATSRLARMIFPDCVGGFPAPEEVVVVDEQDLAQPATVSVAQEPAKKPAQRRKPKAPAPAPKPQPETAQDGPPLPGEDGYDQLAPEPGVDTETGEIVDAEIIDEPAAEPEQAGPKISPAQMKKLHATLRDLDVADREHGLSMISDICAQPIESTKDLTREQASMVIDTLSQMAANEVPS